MTVKLRDSEIVNATCLRIPLDQREEGLFYYDVRHDDECQGIPCSVEYFVFINHLGTIVTNKPLTLRNGYLILNEDDQNAVLTAF
ncbi:LPD28 domain-containing protein [Lysinibacillus sp. UGB7]|uniref:LPD28 domain-containing protein n=1 Tax=Lysinibacillus sp. UGB7 TaxID=3411039 RepID=UPI003B797BEA